MSILIIMGACTLIAAPCEAVASRRTNRRNRARVKPYRKPDARYRHKKSPYTYHSNGL